MKKNIIILLIVNLFVAFTTFVFFYLKINNDFEIVQKKWENELKKNQTYKQQNYVGWNAYDKVLKINENYDIKSNISEDEFKTAKKYNCKYLVVIPFFSITSENRTDEDLIYKSYYYHYRYIGLKDNAFEITQFNDNPNYFLSSIYKIAFQNTIGVENNEFDNSNLNSKYYSTKEDLSKIVYLQQGPISTLNVKELDNYLLFYEKGSHVFECKFDLEKLYPELKKTGIILLVFNFVVVLILWLLRKLQKMK